MTKQELIKINSFLQTYLDELSGSDGAGEYMSKYAWSNDTSKQEKDAEDDGYEVVDTDDEINEVTYRNYKKDDSISQKRKLNTAISKINGQLFRIEQVLDQNLKLKVETDMDSDTHYWNTTRNNIAKITSKLDRIKTKFKKITK